MTSNAIAQTEAPLLTETKDGVATLTLNRPGRFNALSSALIEDLQSTFDPLAADPAVIAFVPALTALSAVLAGTIPALRASTTTRRQGLAVLRPNRVGVAKRRGGVSENNDHSEVGLVEVVHALVARADVVRKMSERQHPAHSQDAKS